MSKLLVDENLSPSLALYLRRKGYISKAVRDLAFSGKPDKEILRFAKSEQWIVITADLEFGRFFYEKFGEVSMVILRS